jgi:hypothetical protein
MSWHGAIFMPQYEDESGVHGRHASLCGRDQTLTAAMLKPNAEAAKITSTFPTENGSDLYRR